MKLFIEAERSGYSADQCGSTMTVEELISYLKQFDGETPVYISNDNGYTFGSINYDSFRDDEEGEDYDE